MGCFEAPICHMSCHVSCTKNTKVHISSATVLLTATCTKFCTSLLRVQPSLAHVNLGTLVSITTFCKRSYNNAQSAMATTQWNPCNPVGYTMIRHAVTEAPDLHLQIFRAAQGRAVNVPVFVDGPFAGDLGVKCNAMEHQSTVQG